MQGQSGLSYCRWGLVGGMALVLAGCSGSAMTLAPASATTPYHGSAGTVAEAGKPGNFAVAADPALPVKLVTPEIDAKHVYGLAELIDIAELANPVTRAAWARAREAAAATGAVDATYLPVLTANVLAGYAQTSTTVPGIDAAPIEIPAGTLTTTGGTAIPSLAVSWLLFDFGGRDAARESARQLSFAANVTFNGAHQTLIFNVASAYYQYSAARAQSRINRSALDNATQVLDAAEARQKQGIATTMEVAQARQQVAQAKFDLTQATGSEHSTYQVLLEAMGISPTTKLKVDDIAGRRLPRAVPADLDKLILASLQRRPDIQAAFARVKANKAGIAAAEAEFLPKIAVTGALNRTYAGLGVEDSRFGSLGSIETNQPNASIMLGLSLPIYDGGLRKSRLEAAEAQAAAAEAEFTQLQGTAAKQIVLAYDMLRTALSGYEAAGELVTAGRTNYDAALDYYRNGLGTLSDVSVAQTAYLKAQYALAQARSDAFVTAASLAFSTGALTSAGSTAGL